jgi:hypothetical protein
MLSAPRALKATHLIAGLVFAAALALYLVTLAPTVVAMFDDSLEFQVIAYQLGIAHPTGYPLYSLLGWLFTRLPVGDVAYRVNLLSAICGALAVTFVYLIGLELSGRNWPGPLAAICGAATLAVTPVFWSQATVAEVYTLNAAFVAGLLWLLVRLAGSESGWLAPGLLPVALVFGLALTHHRTIMLLVPAAALFLWRVLGRARRASPGATAHRPAPGGWRTGARLAAAGLAPLLLYLYLPLRSQPGSLDGSYVNTLAGFWSYVTAAGYGSFIFQNPMNTARDSAFYLNMFWQQFGPVGLLAGLAGAVILVRRGPAGLLAAVAFASYLSFNLVYRVADVEVFFIPLFLVWAIWVGGAAGWLLARLNARHAGWRVSLAGLLLLAQPGLIAWRALPTQDRSRDWATYDYGFDLMHQPLEPGAAIVGLQGEISLVRYFQATQQLRPDLLTVAADRDADRQAAITRLLAEGNAVYLTRDLPGASGQWSLGALGPLIRVNPRPVSTSPPVAVRLNLSPLPELLLVGCTYGRPPSHAAASPLRLTLAWQSRTTITRQLKVSARLLAADGQVLAQTDAVPVHFTYPTNAWRPGEFVDDVYDLPVPAGLPPGEYAPWLILYDPAQAAAEVARLRMPPVALP